MAGIKSTMDLVMERAARPPEEMRHEENTEGHAEHGRVSTAPPLPGCHSRRVCRWRAGVSAARACSPAAHQVLKPETFVLS